MIREALIARTIVELADNLVDDFDLVDLLATLTERCVEVLDIAAAGILLVAADGQLRAMCSSDETSRVVELLDLQAHDGPCMECVHTGAAVGRDLAASHERWPHFAQRALASGFRSVDAVPMRFRGQVIGVLTLLREQRSGLGDADGPAAQALADVATIALLQHRAGAGADVLRSRLADALSDRIVIEQAKGVVAERLQVSIEGALARLRSYARGQDRRLSDLARDIVGGIIDVAGPDRHHRG